MIVCDSPWPEIIICATKPKSDSGNWPIVNSKKCYIIGSSENQVISPLDTVFEAVIDCQRLENEPCLMAKLRSGASTPTRYIVERKLPKRWGSASAHLKS